MGTFSKERGEKEEQVEEKKEGGIRELENDIKEEAKQMRKGKIWKINCGKVKRREERKRSK